jgi:hypothetical protein
MFGDDPNITIISLPNQLVEFGWPLNLHIEQF